MRQIPLFITDSLHVVNTVMKPILWLGYYFKEFCGVFLLLHLMNEAIEEKRSEKLGYTNQQLVRLFTSFQLEY